MELWLLVFDTVIMEKIKSNVTTAIEGTFTLYGMVSSAFCRTRACFTPFSVPVVVGGVLALGRVGCNSADDLLSISVDQLDRVDGQVLIEVSPTLGCVRTQVTLVLPLFCNKTHTHTHIETGPQVTVNMTSDDIS